MAKGLRRNWDAPTPDDMDELLETAAQLVAPALADLEQAFVADLARVLRSSGVAASWKDAGVSAKDLAEHLSAASHGIKQRVPNAAAYADQMRTAVRIVCRRGPR